MGSPFRRRRSRVHRERIGGASTGDVSHPYRTPKVEGLAAGWPAFAWFALWQALQLRGYLDVVAVRVLHHEKEIVSGAMPTRTPPDRHVERGEMIGPTADV